MSAAMSDLDQQMTTEKSSPATLETAEEEVKLNPDNDDKGEKTPCDYGIDMKNRDPNHMNDHVKVQFLEIFGEPDEEVFSFQKVWCLSFRLFTLTKSWCYRITSLILALPLVLCWGIVFALLAFCNNWCYVPGMRCCQIELLPVKKIWDTCIGTFLAPCYEAMGLLCSRIKVNHIKSTTESV